MEDLQAALQSILSDPAQMARVTALAESLGLKPPEEGYEATGNRQQATGDGGREATGNRQQATGDGGREASGNRQQATGDGGRGGPQPHVGAGALDGPPLQAAGEPQDGPVGAASSAFPLPGLDGPELGRLMGLLSASSGSEDRLLNALRPALDPAGQARVDRALRAAKLSRLAGSFFKQERTARV